MRRLLTTTSALLLLAPATLATPDPAGLKQLLADVAKANSQRLIIQQAGRTVVDKAWSGDAEALVPLMFGTATISALAVGCLIADGKLRSLDEPALPHIPQWRGTPLARTRIRDLVEGGRLDIYDPAPIGSLYGRPDMVGYLSKLKSTPSVGRASYSLDAAIFLAPLITSLAGERADKYVHRRLLKPLGITKVRWRRDKADTPDTATGLWLRAADYLKIGELLLNDGTWNGKAILPPGWVQSATTPETGRQRDLPPGVPDGEIGYYLRMGSRALLTADDLTTLRRRQPAWGAKLAPLQDRPFVGTQALMVAIQAVAPDREAYRSFVASRGPFTVRVSRDYGYGTIDFVGQALFVHPRKRLAAVRTVPWDGRPVMRNPAQFEFDDLAMRIFELF